MSPGLEEGGGVCTEAGLRQAHLDDVEDHVLVEAIQDALGHAVVAPGAVDQQQLLQVGKLQAARSTVQESPAPGTRLRREEGLPRPPSSPGNGSRHTELGARSGQPGDKATVQSGPFKPAAGLAPPTAALAKGLGAGVAQAELQCQGQRVGTPCPTVLPQKGASKTTRSTGTVSLLAHSKYPGARAGAQRTRAHQRTCAHLSQGPPKLIPVSRRVP